MCLSPSRSPPPTHTHPLLPLLDPFGASQLLIYHNMRWSMCQLFSAVAPPFLGFPNGLLPLVPRGSFLPVLPPHSILEVFLCMCVCVCAVLARGAKWSNKLISFSRVRRALFMCLSFLSSRQQECDVVLHVFVRASCLCAAWRGMLNANNGENWTLAEAIRSREEAADYGAKQKQQRSWRNASSDRLNVACVGMGMGNGWGRFPPLVWSTYEQKDTMSSPLCGCVCVLVAYWVKSNGEEFNQLRCEVKSILLAPTHRHTISPKY